MSAPGRRIAILTGGGDCPGLNAVIRAVVKAAQNVHGWEVWGVRNGFEGFLEAEGAGIRPVRREDVAGILPRGGTILGASNRCNIFAVPDLQGTPRDRSDLVPRLLGEKGIEGLIVVGGEGTQTAARRLHEMGVPVVGVPKTIDNDVGETDVTFGHDSAVSVVADAVDRLHTTAESHHRVMCVEVMGRHTGWIALNGGLAGGADVILIPEIPYDPVRIAERIQSRMKQGRRFSIVAISEGAKRQGGAPVYRAGKGADPILDRLGGVSILVREELEAICGLEVRNVILGHVQRGGSPTPFDRVLGTRFGARAVGLLAEEAYGRMVAVRGTEIVSVPIADAVRRLRTVDPAGDLVRAARDIGVTFAAADGSDDAFAEARARYGAP
jgi:phosphofructokinase-like protein